MLHILELASRPRCGQCPPERRNGATGTASLRADPGIGPARATAGRAPLWPAGGADVPSRITGAVRAPVRAAADIISRRVAVKGAAAAGERPAVARGALPLPDGRVDAQLASESQRRWTKAVTTLPPSGYKN